MAKLHRRWAEEDEAASDARLKQFLAAAAAVGSAEEEALDALRQRLREKTDQLVSH